MYYELDLRDTNIQFKAYLDGNRVIPTIKNDNLLLVCVEYVENINTINSIIEEYPEKNILKVIFTDYEIGCGDNYCYEYYILKDNTIKTFEVLGKNNNIVVTPEIEKIYLKV